MQSSQALTTLGAVATLSVCVATDLKSRRIPNVVTGPAMLAGIVINCFVHGLAGLGASLGGLALGLMILLPPFALGGIRGGDVKMMGAVGAFLGPKLLVAGLLVGLAAGGVIAAGVAFRRGRLRETLGRTWSMVAASILTRSSEPLRAPTTLPGRILLPYSVPLAFGTIATIGWTMCV